MSTTAVPICSNPHASRPRIKNEPRPHYRPFMFSDKDLVNIDIIQRLSIRAQPDKPKQAVSMAAAVRLAIGAHAAQLKREEAEVHRSVSPLSIK